jgi:hypothetical protein
MDSDDNHDQATASVDSPGESLGSRLKAAGQLAAQQAHRTKIATISLPSAYKALGKHVYGVKAFADDFSEMYQDFERLSKELKAIKTEASGRPMGEGFTGKAKAAANSVRDMAQSKGIELKIAHSFAKFGQAVYEKHGERSGPAEFVKPITTAKSQIIALDKEIAQLSTSKPGERLTTKRLALSAVTVIALLILSVGYIMFRSSVHTRSFDQPNGVAEVNRTSAVNQEISGERNDDPWNNATATGTVDGFLNSMKEMMSESSSLGTFPVGMNYESKLFKSKLGQCKSDMAYLEGRRLWMFPCTDGRVSLIVRILGLGDRVIVDGINTIRNNNRVTNAISMADFVQQFSSLSTSQLPAPLAISYDSFIQHFSFPNEDSGDDIDNPADRTWTYRCDDGSVMLHLSVEFTSNDKVTGFGNIYIKSIDKL